MAHRRGTRSGRGDHGVIAGKGLDEGASGRDCLRDIPGVDVHLATAGLGLREVDLHAEAAQQLDGGLPCVGVHGVVQAGDEQGHLHGKIRGELPSAVKFGVSTSLIGSPICMVLPNLGCTLL